MRRRRAGALHMQSAFVATAGPADNLKGSGFGNCILSKYPLTAPAPAAGIGMWASTQVAAKRFLIGSVTASPAAGPSASGQFLDDWQKRGSPPIVCAGEFPIGFADNDPVQLRSGWFDGLSAWERLLPHSTASQRRAQIFLSPGWSCRAGGAIGGYALAPCWIDASSSASATAPTTQAATQPADD